MQVMDPDPWLIPPWPAYGTYIPISNIHTEAA